MNVSATILYDDHVHETQRRKADSDELWVSVDALKEVTGFELKAEGACLDDVCVPLGPDGLLEEGDGGEWFNLTALADKLGQSWAVDESHNLWSFGQVSQTRGAFLESAVAPDFALEDIHGKTVRLSDFRGKKVLLITWASW